MANQQLLDYIRQQLQQGVDEETIKNSLRSQGWQLPDLEEAFSMATHPTKFQSPADSVSSKPYKSKKWVYILGGSLIIIVVVAAAGIFFTKETQNTNEPRDSVKEISPGPRQSPILEQTTLASTACSQLPTSGLQNLCYADVAVVERDEQLCERIGTKLMRENCFAKVAVEKQDRTLCDRFTQTEFNKYCVDAVKLAEARSQRNSKICESITEQSLRDACVSSVAKATQNIELCNSVTGLISQATCFIHFAVTYSDLAICDKIRTDSTTNWQGKCYRDVIAARGDASQCESYSDIFDPIRCRFDVALAVQNPKPCELEPDEDFRSTCYLEIATMKLDRTLCEKMTKDSPSDELGYKECLSRISRAEEGLKPCEGVAEEILRDRCYLYQAQAFRIGGFGVPAVCERIKDPSLVQKCREITDVANR